MIAPIKPQDLAAGIVHAAPPFVVEAFNDLITANFLNGRSRFTQKEVIQKILTKVTVPQEAIYKNGWLNVEALYRSQGWVVEYDKPGYNESYEAYFVFTTKK